MTSRLNPYISFDGNARQAMEFYEQVFGGTLHDEHVRRVRDGRLAGRRQDHARACWRHRQRLHADGGRHPEPGWSTSPASNITVSLSGDDGDELRGYWEKLSAGGTVAMPLEKQMWGDEFGMCTDRFGIDWMVNIGQPQA